MKKAILGFMISWSFTALAGNFEIPYSQEDFVPQQGLVDHYQYRVKPFQCAGKTMGVLYLEISGWSTGSKLKGVCHWDKKGDVKTCAGDQSLDARVCYNKAIDVYGLSTVYDKAYVPELEPPPVEMERRYREPLNRPRPRYMPPANGGSFDFDELPANGAKGKT